MKKFLRLFALLLALIMLFSTVVGCELFSSDDDDDDDDRRSTRKKRTTVTTEEQSPTTPAVTDPNSPVTPGPNDSYDSKLPTLDWEEDYFYILGRSGGSYSQVTNFEIWRDSKPGDVVGDAVWSRNERIRKKYNFVVEQNLVSNTKTEAQVLYDAQDDIYDLVIYRPTTYMAHAYSGYLLDLNSIKYIDFDHPTWSESINTELTVGGKLYATTSKFLLQDKAMTYMLFYNRDYAEALELGALENLVTSNQWTLENFNTICSALAIDLNDNNKEGDAADGFALACESNASFTAFCFGGGFTFGNNNGKKVTLTGATKDMENIVSAVGATWFDNTLCCTPTSISTGSSAAVFQAERALFYSSFPSALDNELDSDHINFAYGVLPFPKYSATQTDYHCWINADNSSLFAIPYTVADPDQVGFYLEAVSEESCDTSYYAYVELKCKIQDAYDSLMADMLGLCFDSVKYDVVALINPASIYEIINSSVPEFRTNVFKRLYEAKGSQPSTTLDNYVDSFKAM